jgi:DNA-binding NarL/FixJ family response regulator
MAPQRAETGPMVLLARMGYKYIRKRTFRISMSNSRESRIEDLRIRRQALKASLDWEISRLERILTQSFPSVRQRRGDGVHRGVSQAEEPDADVRCAIASLTARERQVLRCIAEGSSTKEVATKLGIRFKTAACHRHRIMQKLKVHETASLVRIAIRSGVANL